MAEKTFENSLARLEEITRKIEAGDLGLEESLRMFEEGMQLAGKCEKKLAEARQKVEFLIKKDDLPSSALPSEPSGTDRSG